MGRSDAKRVERDQLSQGATMPFSRYDIDNEHIEAMRRAFQRVCDMLQLDSGREDPMTEIIVMKIVESWRHHTARMPRNLSRSNRDRPTPAAVRPV